MLKHSKEYPLEYPSNSEKSAEKETNIRKLSEKKNLSVNFFEKFEFIRKLVKISRLLLKNIQISPEN